MWIIKNYLHLRRPKRFLSLTLAIDLILNLFIVKDADAGLVEFLRKIFSKPNRVGISPGKHRGAATQDRCPFLAVSQPYLTALVPSTQNGEIFIEKTVESHPTFWFYVPYSARDYVKVEFVLIDQNEQDVYKAIFPIVLKEPGIISIKIPETAPELDVNQKYRWVFSIICNPANRSGDITVNGWLKRVEKDNQIINAINQIASSKSPTQQGGELATIYAQHEIWYETLNALGQAYQSYPQDSSVRAEWLELLQAINLEDLSNYPVMPCCLSKEGKSTAIPPE
jgi:hypothetical protein